VTEPPGVASLVRRVGVFSWSVIGLALFVALIGWLLIEGRIILAPLLVSVVFIFLLNPIVSYLKRRGVPRVVGTGIGFLILLGVLILLGALVIPSVVDQATSFTETFPEIFDNTQGQLTDLITYFGFEPVELWTYDQLVDYLNDPSNQETITSFLFGWLRGVTAGVFEFILVFLLGPVLAFYLLVDLPNVQQRVLELVPKRNRAETAYVGRSVNAAVGGFLRGQLIVALIVGVLLSFGYWLIDLPFWLLIGMVGGLLNIVPFLGPWVGGILGVLVALATTDLTTAIWAAIVAVIVQQIDNNLVSPTVLRATVRLHPAVTLLVIVLAGAIAGFWGIIIAVPLAAATKIIVGHWWRTRILDQSWEEASEALLSDPTRETPVVETDDEDEDADDAPSPAGGNGATGDADDG
jgi:predicted PurR-regulated permease PerM